MGAGMVAWYPSLAEHARYEKKVLVKIFFFWAPLSTLLTVHCQ